MDLSGIETVLREKFEKEHGTNYNKHEEDFEYFKRCFFDVLIRFTSLDALEEALEEFEQLYIDG